MSPSARIRHALDEVAALRVSLAADAKLQAASHAVKVFQARRFAGTYADLLQNPTYSAAATFFLDELYGLKDFASRDKQFSRIAATIERSFPASVAEIASSLAELHAMTETLDYHMASAWSHLQTSEASLSQRYVLAWRNVGQFDLRSSQLSSVIFLGRHLEQLTRMRGLKMMLRIMRAPAAAAGLVQLQRFLETGFDTFWQMCRSPGACDAFLGVIEARESELISLLGSGNPVTSATRLDAILGVAR
jgi:hypothetical protein